MKVRELLEVLKDIDPETEVYMSYTETGGCCCNSYQDTEEVPVDTVIQTAHASYAFNSKGRRMPVTKNVIMLSEY